MSGETENKARRAWWDERYRRNDTGWDQGEAAPAVARAADFFPAGSRVVVPGCGRGHDAAEFARRGFTVEGWDFSRIAIREASAQYRLPGLTFRNCDFFASESKDEAFDAAFEHTFLCAVGPDFYEAGARQFSRLLRSGGLLFAVLFTGLEEENPPPWRIETSTAERVFGRWFEIVCVEPVNDGFPHRLKEETYWQMRKR